MEHEERRRRRRFSVSWPIRVLDNEREVARGETANISRSGVIGNMISGLINGLDKRKP